MGCGGSKTSGDSNQKYKDFVNKIPFILLSKIKPDFIITDAMPLKDKTIIPYLDIIKGDAKSITIAAASVIAKVTRDHMLYEIDKEYPMYDLKNNKGYGTKKHIEAIKQYGITKYHRLSYKPVSMYQDKINE